MGPVLGLRTGCSVTSMPLLCLSHCFPTTGSRFVPKARGNARIEEPMITKVGVQMAPPILEFAEKSRPLVLLGGRDPQVPPTRCLILQWR